MMAKITGGKNFKSLMAKLRDPKHIAAALYKIGQDIELDAEHLITEGSISGKGHIPSLPGQPPNRDTGVLDSHIETNLISGTNPKVEVSSNAPYAGYLEFGTSKMAERPYMRPALAKNRDDIPDAVAVTVNSDIKSSRTKAQRPV